jgi:hypothetical protein
MTGGTMSALAPRTEYVLNMTPDERVSALTLLGHRHPEVFDEIAADIEEQRRIRARREAAREDGGDDDR